MNFSVLRLKNSVYMTVPEAAATTTTADQLPPPPTMENSNCTEEKKNNNDVTENGGKEPVTATKHVADGDQSVTTVPARSASGETADTLPVTELMETARNALYRSDTEMAVKCMASTAERMTAAVDGDALHPSLAPVWTLYGEALLENFRRQVG
jgi:hypothetical protein